MIDKIASLKPDLIVAADAGLDQDTYTKLSGIAPTIAQAGKYAFFEPWKDQAKAIGQAVFKPAEMDAVVKAVDNKFSSAAPHIPVSKIRRPSTCKVSCSTGRPSRSDPDRVPVSSPDLG